MQIFASNHVAKETNVTNTIRFIELTKSAREWAENIHENNNYKKNNIELMKKYDSKEIAKDLQHKYKELYKNA